jgi:transposase
MKAGYQYRIYPTDQQQKSLAKLFGCVRVVWNDALGLCKRSEKLPKNSDLNRANRYFLSFVVEVLPEIRPAIYPSVGIDLAWLL